MVLDSSMVLDLDSGMVWQLKMWYHIIYARSFQAAHGKLVLLLVVVFQIALVVPIYPIQIALVAEGPMQTGVVVSSSSCFGSGQAQTKLLKALCF